ncbi:MAG: RNA polymerase sigma factor [Myxococcota bacterium]
MPPPRAVSPLEPERSERVVAHTALSTSDAELVQKALEGSAWAEAALCRRHVRPLLGMLTRLLGSSIDADDVAQDAVVAALESLARLRNPAQFRTWLYGIAANLAKRRLRRRRFEQLLGLSPSAERPDLEVFGSRAISPESQAELAMIEAKVLRLPLDLRIAWSLRFVEGYELIEVAEICGCSLATLKRRLDKAQARLQVYLRLERTER